MKKVVFYFPYMEECGVPVLFLRMSRWLAANHSDEYDVYVGDFENGAMARNITKEDNVGVLISGIKEGIKLEDQDILVMQSMNPYYWPKELHLSPKTKILFWTLHFMNLTPSLLPLPGLRELPYNHLWIYKTCAVFYKGLLSRLTNLIDVMMQNGAHYFMDISTCKQTQLHLPIHIPNNCDYLPVPASDYNGTLKSCRKSKEVINACWIGRISFEKTPILIHTLERCSKYALANKQRIFFHIRGFGEFIDKLEKLDLNNEYFEMGKCTPIKFNDIDKFLLEDIDIMFAMGTSALEAAKLGIPTVLVDVSCTPVKRNYKFRFISERTGYDLGHLVEKGDFENEDSSMDYVMNSIINDYSGISYLSRSHFVEKHSLTSVGNKFYNIISKMTFTFDMMDPKVIERPYLLKLYNKMRGFNRFD